MFIIFLGKQIGGVAGLPVSETLLSEGTGFSLVCFL